jgi:hypothetical protein
MNRFILTDPLLCCRLCTSTVLAAGTLAAVQRITRETKVFMHACQELFHNNQLEAAEYMGLGNKTADQLDDDYVEQYDRVREATTEVIPYVPASRTHQQTSKGYVNKEHPELIVHSQNTNLEMSFRDLEKMEANWIEVAIGIARDLGSQVVFDVASGSAIIPFALENGVDLEEAEKKDDSNDKYREMSLFNELTEETQEKCRKLPVGCIRDLFGFFFVLVQQVTALFRSHFRQEYQKLKQDKVHMQFWRDIAPQIFVRSSLTNGKPVKYKDNVFPSVERAEQLNQKRKTRLNAKGEQNLLSVSELKKAIPIGERKEHVKYAQALVAAHLRDTQYHLAWKPEFQPQNWLKTSTKDKPIVIPLILKFDGGSASKRITRLVTTGVVMLGVWSQSSMQ